MRSVRVAVIGAGIAGLTSAIDLARAGCEVTVFERAAAPGGKMREVAVGEVAMDAGPTVFTLRGVFEALFADCGESLERHVTLVPAQLLARHAWNSHEQLDLYAAEARSVEAIGRFAGAAEARGFVRFAAQARRIFRALETSFIAAPRPSPFGLARRMGVAGVFDLMNLQPFATLWRATGEYFRDPRLRQLFARYATYCGSSPFACPATLMLVAHVEQSGVWYVAGGMHRLALELAALARRQGAVLRYASGIVRIHIERGRVSGVETGDGTRHAVDAVVSNADNNALASGRFGGAVERAVRPTARDARSLSAVTWNLHARTHGFELAHHSVFFNGDYHAEFDDIFRRRRLPRVPTIYVCAQDRQDAHPVGGTAERLLCLVNAPATGDCDFDQAELDSCERHTFQRLAQFGLHIEREPQRTVRTSPADFERLFPATGGALYGPASHGWASAFKRVGSRSRVPGLYLAGGSTHPGPGVPMAATSGRLAAACLMQDYASIARYRPVATFGGTSMG